MLMCYHQIGFTKIMGDPDGLEMVGWSMILALLIFILVTIAVILLTGMKALYLKYRHQKARNASKLKSRIDQVPQVKELVECDHDQSQTKHRRSLFVAEELKADDISISLALNSQDNMLAPTLLIDSNQDESLVKIDAMFGYEEEEKACELMSQGSDAVEEMKA